MQPSDLDGGLGPGRLHDRQVLALVAAQLRTAGCVFAEEEAAMLLAAAGDDNAVLEQLVRRRCDGEPLELVIGFAEFAGCRVALRPGVFVPRQRTVRLLDRAIALLGRLGSPEPVVVDLGTGSGALALALTASPAHRIFAIDCSAEAAACARLNLAGTRAVVIMGSGLSALPEEVRGRVDLVVANLPYVPTGQIGLLPREARLHEPLVALDGGIDGLDPLRSAVGEATAWLRPQGRYLGEVHVSQVPAVRRLARHLGLHTRDEVDPDTMTAVVELSLRPASVERPRAPRDA